MYKLCRGLYIHHVIFRCTLTFTILELLYSNELSSVLNTEIGRDIFQGSISITIFSTAFHTRILTYVINFDLAVSRH